MEHVVLIKLNTRKISLLNIYYFTIKQSNIHFIFTLLIIILAHINYRANDIQTIRKIDIHEIKYKAKSKKYNIFKRLTTCATIKCSD